MISNSGRSVPEFHNEKLREFIFHSYRITYIFIKITRGSTTAPALRKQLLDHGIAIHDCSNFVGLDDTYFRVAVRTREENTRLIDALKDVVRL